MSRAVLRCSDPKCSRESESSGISYSCNTCGSLLEVAYDFQDSQPGGWRQLWHSRLGGDSEADRSGVWRFRELLPFLAPGHPQVSLGEGGTPLVPVARSASWAGLDHVWVKHQGANPTGSFKDLGMTACISHAVSTGASAVACASTGNTSASMAAYAARAGLPAVLFAPAGAVSTAKLAQAIDFGARLVETGANFDQAFTQLRRLAQELGWYVVNSINPYRLEGQKTVILEVLEQRQWRVPDYLVVPGGNLGNVSAIGKGLMELAALGLITKVPRVIVVQAEGSNPFFRLWSSGRNQLEPLADPKTRASAIRIGNPANWPKALRVLKWTEGSCESVSDQEIGAAKEALSRDGVGCEPASAATVAGLRKLRQTGGIEADAEVVVLVTGHQLKDTQYILETHNSFGHKLQLAPAAGVAELARWMETAG
jgi:threonine synthase